MISAIACQAIGERKRVQVIYDDEVRVVEVHVVGTLKTGSEAISAYQVRGGSKTANVGWKVLHIEKIRSFELTEEKSEAPRGIYNRQAEIDKFVHLLCYV